MNNKVLIFWKRYSYLIMLSNLLVGLIHPMIALVFIICMMGPALIGFFTGRFWCGNICPIGNFFENVSIKVSKKHRAPIRYKSKYVKVIVAIIMMSMFIYDMKSAWGNGNQVGLIYFQMIMESIIVGTVLSLLYNRRIWCHFCPMGSMGALVARFSKNKRVLQVSSKCTSCGKCSTNCPMGISPANFKDNKINSPDCIQCMECMEVCPQKAISYGKVIPKNNLVRNIHTTTNKDNNVNEERFLEKKMVAAIIFTIPLIILSMDIFSSHIVNTTASFEKIAIMTVILASIVILTCIDIFQLGISAFLKGCPNKYTVITTGILSWFIYELIVFYLLITVDALFINKMNLQLIAITVTAINIVRYLEYKGKLPLFKFKK